MMKILRLGIIGGGWMGRVTASPCSAHGWLLISFQACGGLVNLNSETGTADCAENADAWFFKGEKKKQDWKVWALRLNSEFPIWVLHNALLGKFF